MKTEIATVGEDVGKGKIGHLHTHGGTVIVQLLWKALRFFLKILKMQLPNDAAIPLLGIHPT